MRIYLLILLMTSYLHAQNQYFAIQVVDEQTLRGIPLVELKTVNHITYYTDSNGIVAFYEPGLMERKVFFHISSHGYEFAKDGFGYHGCSLQTTPGTTAVLKMKRINVAQRLYRITGQGIYSDSLLVGASIPIAKPVLNALVTGQDTVMAALFNDKIYWFWGDTLRVSYPLGNFAVSGATSLLPGQGGLAPEEGIDFTYFVDDNGFSKKMSPQFGKGLLWIEAPIVFGEANGTRLLVQYERLKSLTEVKERGLAVFNEQKQHFEKLIAFDLEETLYPRGHPFRATVNGEEYIYFSHPHPSPFPNVRVKATVNDLQHPENYQVFSCYPANSSMDSLAENQQLSYGWKTHSIALNTRRQQQLIDSQQMQPDESWLRPRDIMTGKSLMIHAGSVFWNPYRQRWIAIAEQVEGDSSYLGEIWYLEGDTVVGPWVYARKIVTHNRYSFYNPTQHPFFDQDNGRIIYFEGTYTSSFSRANFATPRYEYNQIMYRLELDDPRLFLPCPVYKLNNTGNLMMREQLVRQHQQQHIEKIAFFALPNDRVLEQTIAIRTYQDGERQVLTTEVNDNYPILFYGVADYARHMFADLVPLYADANNFTSVPDTKPLCWVWANPHWQLIVDFQTQPGY